MDTRLKSIASSPTYLTSSLYFWANKALPFVPHTAASKRFPKLTIPSRDEAISVTSRARSNGYSKNFN